MNAHRLIFVVVVFGALIASQPAAAVDVEPAPRHVALAREFLANTQPESNVYSRDRRYTRTPTDLLSRSYVVHTDCTGFVESVLERSYGLRPHFSSQLLGDRYSIVDYVDGMLRGDFFERVERIQDLRTGDFVAWKFYVIDSSNGSASPDDSRFATTKVAGAETKAHRGGVGRGKFYLFSGDSGELKAVSYGFPQARLQWQGRDWQTVMGRVPSKR